MSDIFIGNVGGEHMIRDIRTVPAYEIPLIAESARRLLWYAADGDALVLPVGPSQAYLAHVSELTGLDPRTVRIFDDPGGGPEPPILVWDTLTRPELVSALRSVSRTGEWQLRAYYADRTVAWLAERLGIMLPHHDFLREGGAELLNSKATFRRLASGLGAPLARGAVVSSSGMLFDLAAALLDEVPAVILKQDYCSATLGNIVLTREPDLDYAGAMERVVVRDRTGLLRAITGLWSTLVPGGYGELVVEEYHAGSDSLYVEIDVSDGEPAILGWGRERMEPHWVGFEISASVLPEPDRTRLLDIALLLGRQARDLGYRGLMSVDAIRTPGGALVLNEQNGRLGGCSHIHYLLRRLARWPERDLVTLSRNSIPSGPLTVAKERLRRAGLEWSAADGVGVLILADDPGPPCNVEIMTVATDEDQARELERRALAELAATVATAPEPADATPVATARS